MPSHSPKKLIIVESPTKAKTIRSFLKEENVIVEACYGHVRDLPTSAKEIPKDLKEEEWANLGINVKENFKPLYIIPKDKTAVISKLKKLLKEADELYLATDEDREGESISWHLLEILKPKVPFKRMVFHEITQQAITHSFQNMRQLDMNLVNSQEARRLVDRLYGYSLSPLLWKKLAYGLSAGRVQSAGLRMLVEQEIERLKFKKAYYHSLEAIITKEENFSFNLIEWQGKKIVTGKHINPYTGKLNEEESANLHWLEKEEAFLWKNLLEGKKGTITQIQRRQFSLDPPLPFITSSLQQESNRILGLSARETMRIAQSLYEEGFITYMRTDSTSLSEEAQKNAKNIIKEKWNQELINPYPLKGKITKGAQEAHEAIRPAGNFQDPLLTSLSGISLALYTLIYNRTLASLMIASQKETTKYTLEVEKEFIFSASGTKIIKKGFLEVYPEREKEEVFPLLKEKEEVVISQIKSKEHETKAPSRYTEAGLISRLEKEGIGRPSTYASIIGVLLEREYVYKTGQTLIPTFMAMAVTKMLKEHFSQFIDYDFTSEMENKLDLIAEGKFDKEEYLKEFFLGKKGLESIIEKEESKIDPKKTRLVEKLTINQNSIEVKVNRSGAYLSWEEKGEIHTLGLDPKTAPSELDASVIEKLKEQEEKSNAILGYDPKTNDPIFFRVGKYGPYLQVGEKGENNPKPKTVRLHKGATPENLSWENIIKELSLPRLIGEHPQTKEPITGNKGPFGPFISYEDLFISLKEEDKIFTITLEESLKLIEEKILRNEKNTLKKWETEEGEASILRKGRFGLYLKLGKDNIPLGKTITKEEVLSWKEEDILQIYKERKKSKKSKK